MNLNKALIMFALFWVSCGTDQDTDKLVTITTRLGDIKLVLFEDTPMHKESFLELAEEGAYDSTTFYRVINNFMIQGGDVALHQEFEQESLRLIPAEISPNHIHAKGMIGAARQGANVNPEKNSSTQFYIVHGEVFSHEELTTDINKLNNAFSKYINDGEHDELLKYCTVLQDSGQIDALQDLIIEMRPELEADMDMDFENTEITPAQIDAYTTIGGAPHLDGGYTVFGKVVEGMETVDKIAALEVDDTDNPLETVLMTLKIEEYPKDSITAWYGIEYPKTEDN
ncbi:MAG: peptidylprolyl isomerase [Bacteroidota bacterium]